MKASRSMLPLKQIDEGFKVHGVEVQNWQEQLHINSGWD